MKKLALIAGIFVLVGCYDVKQEASRPADPPEPVGKWQIIGATKAYNDNVGAITVLNTVDGRICQIADVAKYIEDSKNNLAASPYTSNSVCTDIK